MKCTWCGKILTKGEYNENFAVGDEFTDLRCCCEEHRDKMLSFNAYAKKNVGKFVGLTILSIVGMITINIIYMAHKVTTFPFLGLVWVGLILGFTLVKFPFCTPQTNSSLGVEKACLIGRIIGIILLVTGFISLGFFIFSFI